MPYALVTCLTCGWVHIALPRAALDAAGVAAGRTCAHCGGSYRHFRDAIEDDVPRGATLPPILAREEGKD